MFAFSILPPIIRYKVLLFLYEKYPRNIAIIDKFVLATLKACNVETATKWIEENREELSKMCTYAKEYIDKVTEKDRNIADVLIIMAPPNMYELCKDKINQVGKTIHNKRLTYSDFESALPYYKQVGIIQDDTEEAREFNDIMEFLYMGRKEREVLCSNVNDATGVLTRMESSE